MHSLRELFRIGNGPSSSHTLAPRRAADQFRQQQPNAAIYRVTLYGSLAATGKGHMTDKAITEALSPAAVEFIWLPDETLPLHPNGMRFEALEATGALLGIWQGYSTGGGALLEEGETPHTRLVYNLHSLTDIMKHCSSQGLTYWEYVESMEGEEIWDYLTDVLHAMMAAIDRGLMADGVLAGGLGVSRKAGIIRRKIQLNGENFLQKGMLPAYALAVAEENAAGNVIVTAPTAGSAGTLPAVLRYLQDKLGCRESTLLHALATAGLIGNLIKHNASISGAEVGCQGEVGAACAMAAGAAVHILGGTIRQIEYAAEMGLEHHLGLTCDPVGGLVQIPCIERNVFAASRAIDSANYALFSDGSHRVPFDDVVQVMRQTGNDLPSLYRETAGGGLATHYRFPPESPLLEK